VATVVDGDTFDIEVSTSHGKESANMRRRAHSSTLNTNNTGAQKGSSISKLEYLKSRNEGRMFRHGKEIFVAWLSREVSQFARVKHKGCYMWKHKDTHRVSDYILFHDTLGLTTFRLMIISTSPLS